MSRAILIIPRGSLTPEQARCLLRGEDGAPGTPGAQGNPGPGVAPGGTTGQALVKASVADYDTSWVDLVSQNVGYTPTGSSLIPAGDVRSALEYLEASVRDWGMPIATNVASFDGINDDLSLGITSAFPDEQTFGFWAKLRSNATSSFFMTSSASGTNAALRVSYVTTLGWYCSTVSSAGVESTLCPASGETGATTTSYGTNEWVHICVQVKWTATRSLRLWVNGQLVSEVTGWSAPTGTLAFNTLRLGVDLIGGVARFRGMMSNFTYHSRTLTRAEILGLARRGRAFAVPATGLVIHCPLDVSITADISGNGNNLTANGGIGLTVMN